MQGNIGCFRVSLCETISIPPKSEMVCPGQVLDLPKFPQIPLLIEPCAKFQDSGRALVARSVVNSSEKIPVRLMNVSGQSQTIFKNTVVGMTFPVKEIIMTETEGSVNHVMPGEREEVLPEHLQELFDRTRPELSAEQTAQVKNILIKFSSIFSRNKDDLVEPR